MTKKQKRNKKRIASLKRDIAILTSRLKGTDERYNALSSKLSHFEFLLQATMTEVRTHIISKIDVEKLAEQERAIVAKWSAEPAEETDPATEITELQG